ncbi:enoyl-CoA hydratase-related protein [Frankia sp. AgB1.9]|uniref:enoyl-CoA hydratase-related protein n=1 Tax=Frankia sp. AgB1.9 TaxID=1836968 RepID=UPI001EE4A158|nr:enoyl-CoA hydratase-related protein [Frankia sp. AgB1.9]
MPEPTSAPVRPTVLPPMEGSEPAGSAPDSDRIGVIGWERDADGIVVLTVDDPDHAANTTNAAFRASLGVVVDRLERARDTITGVVVTSAKKTFVTGADLRELVRLGPADRLAAFETAAAVKDQLRRLETLGRPVVAAIGGAALGGGLEIALACHHRIAADVPGSQLGLPEVTLGLAPSGGGIVRSVRLLGVRSALVNVLLAGQRYSPAQARALGLVDELVGSVDELLPAARAWIQANLDATARWDVPGYQIPGGGPALAAARPALPAGLRRQAAAEGAPAGPAILAAAVEGAQVDLATASVIESRYYAELVTGPVATNMIKAFYFDLGRIGTAVRPAGQAPVAVTRAAVLGAGPTGASLAYALAKAGVDVVLTGASAEAAGLGKGYAERLVADAVRRGSTRPPVGKALLARITATADQAALAGVDVVIEATDPAAPAGTVELAAARDAVPGALLCVASAAPLADQPPAAATSEPGDLVDVVGLRLAGPADRTSLVEIVVGDGTGDAALARAIDLVTQLRKTPIVVHEAAPGATAGAGVGGGSFVGRLLGAFVAEGAAMVGAGVPAASIEQAGTQAGFPSSPLRLLDELTGPAVRGALGDDASAAAAVLDQMIELGRPGRAGGAGFYDYADGRPPGLWPGLRDRFGGTLDPAELAFDELVERLLVAVALAGVRALADGTVRTVAETNIGSLTGAGFPAWTGGVLGYVNGFAGGPAGFVARARDLAARHGDRFAPPPSLVDRAASGELYD